jgi:hypothetical protein
VLRRAVLFVILLAAPQAARATRGRLSLSLLAGGGYATDVFVGAGQGRNAFSQLTPAGRLDLSLAPRWKIAAAADLSYGRYLSTDFDSLAESASLEGRWLGGESWDASLIASGEHADYSLSVSDSPLPPTSSTTAGRLSSLLRVRTAGFEWRVAGVGGLRNSTAGASTIPEDEGAFLAGVMRPLSETLSAALTYKLGRTASEDPDFTYTSHALFGLVSWRLEALDVQGQLQLQTASVGTGARDDLLRMTASAAYPLSETLALEGAYAYTATRSDDPTRPSGRLHLAFLAVRWRFAEVSW